jgi:hypothetical protein
MLSDLQLMRIHVRALFTQNSESRLLFINEPDNAVLPAPRIFLGRTRVGNVWRFRADLPESLVQELDSLCTGGFRSSKSASDKVLLPLGSLDRL